MLNVDYLTLDELADRRAQGWQDVLGIALFVGEHGLVDADDVPVARVTTRPLGGPSAVCEVWRAKGRGQRGRFGPGTPDSCTTAPMLIWHLAESHFMKSMPQPCALRPSAPTPRYSRA